MCNVYSYMRISTSEERNLPVKKVHYKDMQKKMILNIC